jgi:hypothetical protein
MSICVPFVMVADSAGLSMDTMVVVVVAVVAPVPVP